MKLLIKFRGTKIGALFASLIKPQQQPCQVNNKRHKSTKKTKTFFQCYQKGTIVNPSNGKRSKNWDLEDDCMCGSFRNSKKSSKVMEMDLGAVKGIFSAMGMNIAQKGNRGSSKRGTRPTSCNTSPSYDEGISLCCSESSIKEAIAYCKSSLGQSSELTFTSSISSSPSLFVA